MRTCGRHLADDANSHSDRLIDSDRADANQGAKGAKGAVNTRRKPGYAGKVAGCEPSGIKCSSIKHCCVDRCATNRGCCRKRSLCARRVGHAVVVSAPEILELARVSGGCRSRWRPGRRPWYRGFHQGTAMKSRAGAQRHHEPRALHAGAWWAWALALATAAIRTTNPLLLGLLLGVAAFAVASRHTANGGRTFAFFLRLGIVVLVIRLVFEVLFGTELPGTVIVRLPSVPLPAALAGLRIGGAVTAQSMLAATYNGLQLATLLICIGAANALASPRRLLRSLPGALYEVGIAVTVAMSFAPQLVHAAARVRRARRLRGLSSSGLRGWAGVALPVLQGALESSIDLAAAMDSRGFGRRGPVSQRRRRVTTTAVLVGLLAIACAMYGLLDTGSPVIVGLPLLVTGGVIAGAAVVLGGRGVVRSKYRPDRWRAAEWATVAAGAAALTGIVVSGIYQPGSLQPSTYPIVVPQLPWPALLGLAIALTPAFLTSTTPVRQHATQQTDRAPLVGATR